MGVRVISTSAVRCVGNTLLLHGRVYSPPFKITAIGDPAALRRALAATRGSGRSRTRLGTTARLPGAVGTDVTVPAYGSSSVLRSADGTSGATGDAARWTRRRPVRGDALPRRWSRTLVPAPQASAPTPTARRRRRCCRWCRARPATTRPRCCRGCGDPRGPAQHGWPDDGRFAASDADDWSRPRSGARHRQPRGPAGRPRATIGSSCAPRSGSPASC